MSVSTPFDLRYLRAADSVILHVAGEIDMSSASELASAIELAQRDALCVVVDLGQVSFVDTSTLNVLIRFKREFAEREIAFYVLSDGNRLIERLLELTQLRESLGVTDSSAEVVQDA